MRRLGEDAPALDDVVAVEPDDQWLVGLIAQHVQRGDDAVRDGIVHALGILGDEATKPLVVRLDGNNVVEGRRILSEANHPLVTLVDTMDGAARKAAELAAAK